MAKGTRQSHCRRCQASYRHAHYLANRDDYIRREVARMAGYRDANRALLLAYLLDHPCVDCGEADPVILDFDHRDPATKRDEVARLANTKPWPQVLAEIATCAAPTATAGRPHGNLGGRNYCVALRPPRTSSTSHLLFSWKKSPWNYSAIVQRASVARAAWPSR
jgi:hypothetical protein